MTDNQEPFEKSTYKLGEIVVKFSTLDYFINWLIQDFHDADPKETTIKLDDMTFYKRINLLKELYTQKFPDKKTDIDELYNSIDELRNLRNKFFHSLWSIDNDREYSIEYFDKNKSKVFEQITEKDLDHFTEKVSSTLQLIHKHLLQVTQGRAYY